MKELVVEIRESLGLKKGKFADHLGVDAGAISKWEQGLRSPSTEVVGRMLRISKPEQQAKILVAIGATDNVAKFAADILAAHGILVVDADQLPVDLSQKLVALPRG